MVALPPLCSLVLLGLVLLLVLVLLLLVLVLLDSPPCAGALVCGTLVIGTLMLRWVWRGGVSGVQDAPHGVGRGTRRIKAAALELKKAVTTLVFPS